MLGRRGASCDVSRESCVVRRAPHETEFPGQGLLKPAPLPSSAPATRSCCRLQIAWIPPNRRAVPKQPSTCSPLRGGAPVPLDPPPALKRGWLARPHQPPFPPPSSKLVSPCPTARSYSTAGGRKMGGADAIPSSRTPNPDKTHTAPVTLPPPPTAARKTAPRKPQRGTPPRLPAPESRCRRPPASACGA